MQPALGRGGIALGHPLQKSIAPAADVGRLVALGRQRLADSGSKLV